MNKILNRINKNTNTGLTVKPVPKKFQIFGEFRAAITSQRAQLIVVLKITPNQACNALRSVQGQTQGYCGRDTRGGVVGITRSRLSRCGIAIKDCYYFVFEAVVEHIAFFQFFDVVEFIFVEVFDKIYFADIR